MFGHSIENETKETVFQEDEHSIVGKPCEESSEEESLISFVPQFLIFDF
jgi:hypothetical protein